MHVIQKIVIEFHAVRLVNCPKISVTRYFNMYVLKQEYCTDDYPQTG